MKIHEVILMLIDGLGEDGKLSGRTKMQKMCYFYSILNNRDMGYRPHFYGPYSPFVENSLDELEGIGLVERSVVRLGDNADGFEVNRYDYRITKYGEQVINAIANGKEKEDLNRFVEKINKIGIPSTTNISIAAKAYYILARAEMPLTGDEIRKKAGAFNWNINQDSIQGAEGFLEDLGLIKAN
ncbi:MAG: hypothetical protein GY940_28695 [bacterium]|nr:hypothetical protein [bacterium]